MDLGQGSRDSGRRVLSQRRSQVSILGCSSAFWPQPHLPPFFPSYPAVPVGITPTVGCRVFAVSQPLHGSLFIFLWSAWRPRAHSAEPNSIIPSPLCFFLTLPVQVSQSLDNTCFPCHLSAGVRISGSAGLSPQLLLLLSRFSHVRLCVTPETAAHQAPPSLGFSRQEHWSGLPFPSPMQEGEK